VVLWCFAVVIQGEGFWIGWDFFLFSPLLNVIGKKGKRENKKAAGRL